MWAPTHRPPGRCSTRTRLRFPRRGAIGRDGCGEPTIVEDRGPQDRRAPLPIVRCAVDVPLVRWPRGRGDLQRLRRGLLLRSRWDGYTGAPAAGRSGAGALGRCWPRIPTLERPPLPRVWGPTSILHGPGRDDLGGVRLLRQPVHPSPPSRFRRRPGWGWAPIRAWTPERTAAWEVRWSRRFPPVWSPYRRWVPAARGGRRRRPGRTPSAAPSSGVNFHHVAALPLTGRARTSHPFSAGLEVPARVRGRAAPRSTRVLRRVDGALFTLGNGRGGGRTALRGTVKVAWDRVVHREPDWWGREWGGRRVGRGLAPGAPHGCTMGNRGVVARQGARVPGIARRRCVGRLCCSSSANAVEPPPPGALDAGRGVVPASMGVPRFTPRTLAALGPRASTRAFGGMFYQRSPAGSPCSPVV